jgi:hypothetical protein
MHQDCESARRAIEARHFAGWDGLAPGCTPLALFGVPLDDSWGQLPLGETFQPTRSRLLDLAGYYRPIAHVRETCVVMFDCTNPSLDVDWAALMADLGPPELQLDWVLGTLDMPRGEYVYAGRGITVFLNPANDFVKHICVYVPTSAAEYRTSLRPNRAKRYRTSIPS